MANAWYTVRSPWVWVMEYVIAKYFSTHNVVKVEAAKDLPSCKRQQQKQQNQQPSPRTMSPMRNRKRKVIKPCTLRMEFEKDGVFLAVHGTSAAFDGLEDKDELLRTIQRCRCEDLELSPPSILLNWDVRREECRNRVGDRLPSIAPNNTNSNGGATVAVLKEPMGTRGEGIFFVTSADDMYEIIEAHRKRAMEEGMDFLDSIIERKGRIPSWVLQAEVFPPMLIRGRRKFHIRSYVAAIERLEKTSLQDIYVYKRHEIRIAAQPIDENDTTSRDRLSHITNGGMADTTERLLMTDVPELVDFQRKTEQFVAAMFHKHFFPDIARRVGVSAKETSSLESEQKKFAIAGLDLMVCSTGRLYLLEVNVNPAAPPEHTIGEPFKEHLVGFVHDLIDLTVATARGGKPSESNDFVLAESLL